MWTKIYLLGFIFSFPLFFIWSHLLYSITMLKIILSNYCVDSISNKRRRWERNEHLLSTYCFLGIILSALYKLSYSLYKLLYSQYSPGEVLVYQFLEKEIKAQWLAASHVVNAMCIHSAITVHFWKIPFLWMTLENSTYIPIIWLDCVSNRFWAVTIRYSLSIGEVLNSF